MGMLNAIGLQNPGVDQVVRAHPADARFHRDAFLRERLRLHDRRLRRGHAALRRLGDRRHRDQHLLPERQGRRRAVRQLPRDVGARRGGLPRGDEEAADHQALAQPDRHPRERAPLHRGRQRRLAVINTIMGMAIDVKTRRPVIGNVQGGLSGPAIKPIALLKVMQVAEVARPLGVPIIGQGGIQTADGRARVHHRRRHDRRRRHLALLRPAGVPEDQCRHRRVSRRRTACSPWANSWGRSTRRRRPCRPAPAESGGRFPVTADANGRLSPLLHS